MKKRIVELLIAWAVITLLFIGIVNYREVWIDMIEELQKAWGSWSSGELKQDYPLWGIKIFWWGRIGKFVAVIGASTIIVDIIGPERLRSLGESLHTRFNMTARGDLLRESIRWYKKTILGSTEESTLKTAAIESKVNKLNYFLCFVLTVIFLYRIVWKSWDLSWNNGGWVGVLIIMWGMYLIFLFTLSALVTIIIVFILTIIGMFIDYIALMLERTYIDKLVKIAGVIMLFVGFHFDFLAS